MPAHTEVNAIDAEPERSGERVNLLGVFLLQKRNRMRIGDVDDDSSALNTVELRSGDPVFEALRAKFLLKRLLDEIPGGLILTHHEDNTAP